VKKLFMHVVAGLFGVILLLLGYSVLTTVRANNQEGRLKRQVSSHVALDARHRALTDTLLRARTSGVAAVEAKVMLLRESLRLPAVTVGGEMRPTAIEVNSLPKSGTTISKNRDSAASAFQSTKCEGVYPGHLQGICTDERDAIYWSWTDTLVKTDARGHVLKQVKVARHHGDLCFHDEKVYVAVNLGQFNLPAGHADSWVFVYDADTLGELARHCVPEVVHGAGGIGYHDGRFIVVGGLPAGVKQNYLYEYNAKFAFQQRHVLASGYTVMGIQTAAFASGAWWFGCYGVPAVLLRADLSWQLTGRWQFDAALGIVGVADGRFLIGQNSVARGGGYEGRVALARLDGEKGLVLEP
jgi:hypothetical protein